jgi:nicotinamide-nucleotide amidase
MSAMSSLFPADLLQDAKLLLAELQRHSLLIAAAESCTGGLFVGALTEIPGASAMVERGFVTYSNVSKTELLGIDARLIERHGAVSDEVARAMAEGTLERAPVGIAVGITGIAGPDGGSPEKPVGLVYVAVARFAAATLVRECRFTSNDRTEIRLESVREAIALVREALAKGIPGRC